MLQKIQNQQHNVQDENNQAVVSRQFSRRLFFHDVFHKINNHFFLIVSTFLIAAFFVGGVAYAGYKYYQSKIDVPIVQVPSASKSTVTALAQSSGASGSPSVNNSKQTAPSPAPSPQSAANNTGSNSSATSEGASSADLSAIHAILLDEQNHGWDSCYNGVAINWNNVAINWNGSGQPDPSPCTRHEDRLTAFRFLYSLLLYRSKTGTSEFNNEINLMQSHVLSLFTTANPDPRGWLYPEFVDIARMTGNSQFTEIANAMLNLYATAPFNNTRPDYQIEEASALIESGKSSYVSQGESEMASYWQQEFLTDVDLINDTPIKSSEEGDIAVALARSGQTDKANLILKGMQALWDSQYGGYEEGATYSNGQLSLQNKKTGGRMMNMLELGDVLGNTSLKSTMDTLFHAHIYQTSPSGYEGVLYEQQPNWSQYVLNGTTENWVTSEANGIAMIAILLQ